MTDSAVHSENDDAPSRKHGLVKMSALARLSGVPAATIKHYVREGLLPEPTRTSRNMAYYDPQVVARIEHIKELQRTRFLPLKVIKEILRDTAEQPDEAVGAAIARVLAQTAPGAHRTREELVASGMPAAQLDFLKTAGLLRPELRKTAGGVEHEVYTGDDVELLRVLGAARKAGITDQMLPITVLGEYAQALSSLVRAELRLFREGVIPKAGGQLVPIAEAATTLSEKLVVLLRRKLLLPTLEALLRESVAAAPSVAPAPTPKPTSVRPPAPRRRRAR